MEDGWGRRGWRIEQITWHLKLWNMKLLTWSGIDNNDTLKVDTWTLPPPHPSPPLSPPPSLPSPSCLVLQLCHGVLHALSPCGHIILLCSTWLWELIPGIGRRRSQWTFSSKNDWHGNCMYRFMLSVSMGCLAASLSNSAFKRGVYRRPQSTTVSYKRISLLLWVYRYCYILNAVSPPFCLPR